jgi:hypothetical protein
LSADVSRERGSCSRPCSSSERERVRRTCDFQHVHVTVAMTLTRLTSTRSHLQFQQILSTSLKLSTAHHAYDAQHTTQAHAAPPAAIDGLLSVILTRQCTCSSQNCWYSSTLTGLPVLSTAPCGKSSGLGASGATNTPCSTQPPNAQKSTQC